MSRKNHISNNGYENNVISPTDVSVWVGDWEDASRKNSGQFMSESTR